VIRQRDADGTQLMSKAFTRESDDAPESPLVRPVVVLPPGVKNLLTPSGALQLQKELERLTAEEAALRAGAGTNDEAAKRRQQALAARALQIQRTLQTAVITAPPAEPKDTVQFGATVEVRERSGEETSYRIVGVDETDLDRNWVSWLSPIAKALLNKRVGDRVRLKLPGGEEELEVLGVTYE
jgi:transcription elongation factor GreB